MHFLRKGLSLVICSVAYISVLRIGMQQTYMLEFNENFASCLSLYIYRFISCLSNQYLSIDLFIVHEL